MAPSYGINTGLVLAGVEFGVFLYAGRTQDGETTPDCKCPRPAHSCRLVAVYVGSEMSRRTSYIKAFPFSMAVSELCQPQNVTHGNQVQREFGGVQDVGMSLRGRWCLG